MTAILDGAANIKAWDCLTARVARDGGGILAGDREMRL
jgi:hypothetical protein